MARLAVFSFAVAFLIFTFVTAVPDEYISTIEPVTELSESSPKTTNTILLPSEKSESEPVDFKPDDALEPKSDVESVPTTTMHLRPANRQFPLRPFIPFRHKQDCRFHRKVRPFNPRHMQNIYIPYGNDMLQSNGRISFDPESQGFVRPIHARWVTFQDDADRSKEVVDIIKLHHHDHEYNHDDHENDDDHDDHDDHNDHDDHDDHNDEHDHEHDHDHDHDHHDDHEHDRDHDDHEHEHGHHDDREHDRYHDGREHDHDEDHHHRHHHRHHEKEDDMEEHEHKGGFMRKLGKFPLIHF